MGSLFKTKRSLQTIFFDIGGVVARAPMESYLKYGAEIFECTPEALQAVTSRELPALEKGEIHSEEYWERVGRSLAETGTGKAAPTWRFKGFWEGILSDDLQVNKDMIDMVRRLKGHVRVAALSNVILEHAKVLKKGGVYEHFQLVVLSCQVGMRKPDLDIYDKAAELAKTAPERCMLIDDSVENLVAAQKVGYRVLQYTSLDDLRREMYNLGLLDHA